MKSQFPVVFIFSVILFILINIWLFKVKDLFGGLGRDSTFRFIVLGWINPTVLAVATMTGYAVIDIATSTDSFAGFGPFVMTPILVAGMAVINLWLFAIRKKNDKLIYICALIPALILLGDTVHTISDRNMFELLNQKCTPENQYQK